MKRIGITGKSGSGKTTLATVLAEKLNAKSISIDPIGHQATSHEKIVKQLCEVFGNTILDEKGKVDRKKLGQIVFSSKEKMDILTQITWEYMQDIIDQIIEEERPQIVIFEWALLPISKYWEQCDIKILVQADETARKDQVIGRDHITEEYFLKRDSQSLDYSSLKFDFIFENDYKKETIEQMATTIKVE